MRTDSFTWREEGMEDGMKEGGTEGHIDGRRGGNRRQDETEIGERKMKQVITVFFALEWLPTYCSCFHLLFCDEGGGLGDW